MATIPAGTFTMGSVGKEPASWREEAEPLAELMLPAHPVTLPAYCIDVVQVTHTRYEACIARGECTAPQDAQKYPECHWKQAAFSEAPMQCTSFEQAEGYCKAQGKRLPTEPEWERAARGNDDRLFPWGDTPVVDITTRGPDHPVCTRYGSTHEFCPVGSAPSGKSPFGVLDMAGGAYDWTSSRLCTYPDHACTNAKRVARGGRMYWVTRRHEVEQDQGSGDVGFRCALSLAPR